MGNNLFFVWTPFQFFVAQNIIIQEKLENNILLCGYLNNEKHFYDSYNLMKIESLWSKIYKFDDLSNYARIGGLKAFFNFKQQRKIVKNDKRINDIIEKHEIKNLYLGDMNNISCKFSALRYSHKGVNIIFYEEGASHYYYHKIEHSKSLLRIMNSLFLDLFFYLPKFNFSFAKYIFLTDLVFDNLLIATRYNILPKYQESYDKQLKITNVFSEKVNKYLKKDLQGLIERDKKRVLFLSQPLEDEWGSLDIMILTLRKYFTNNDFSSCTVVIKFHPRDSKIKKQQIALIFQELKIDYLILSKEISLPVEIYLMNLQFEKVIYFFTSTIMYNGYVYPKISTESILSNYIYECDEKKIDVTRLKEILNQIDI